MHVQIHDSFQYFPKQFTVGVLSKNKSWPHSLAAPLNSVAGLCCPALCPGLVLLSSSCPPLVFSCPASFVFFCGRTISDVDADEDH